MNLPENLKYSKTHEWLRQEGNRIYVGITDYAQENLGDIVFVEFPEIDSNLSAGDEAGVVESVKAVSPIYTPVGGKVVAVNPDLEDAPESVNNDPYGSWFFALELSNPEEIAALLDAAAYQAVCE